MRKYSLIMMALALLVGMAQCKKEQVTPSENNGVNITLKVDGGSKKLEVYPATGAVIFTAGDKIYVGNNGKYVGTLTFENGLFQGTIDGDFSTNDFLHFYFVGNKPTSPTELTAGTTSYTVDISDQSAYLPAISYAPSKEKYSPTTTAYTAKLLNKSALVKFVPSQSVYLPITISGMKNEVSINFASNTLTPTGTIGDITLYSLSDTEKWAILLPQDAVPSAAVTGIGFTAENIAVPTITDNMYYNSGIGVSITSTSVIYEINSSNWSTALASFNGESTQNPVLRFNDDFTNWGSGSTDHDITRANGIIDFNGHTVSNMFLKNNVPGESLTLMNGTIVGYGSNEIRIDGALGWNDFYKGTVILENMTITKNGGYQSKIFTDGHEYIFKSGTYYTIVNATKTGLSVPAKVIVRGGYFKETLQGSVDYTCVNSNNYELYGGKYTVRPENSWCASGYSVKENHDSDSGTYPWIVSAD